MVSFKVVGRLGNFLFEASASIGYAIKHDLEFHMPFKSTDPEAFDVYFTHLHHPSFDPNKEQVIISQQGFQYQEIPFRHDWKDKNIILSGYWQSIRYFEDYLPLIREKFGFSWSSRPGVISLHKRLGDYRTLPSQHPIVPESYISRALSYFYKRGYKKFLVFSDEIQECKKTINSEIFPFLEFEYSEGRSVMEDLQLMSECEGHIISNSTFSWWASVLNQNPGKIVVTPHEDNWFGPEYKNLDLSTLLPAQWVRIKY
jgi:hypothetical protein